ncbi:MAG: segregation/condensation protein A [Sphaerochaeta sp.]|nr:segregation/condensation protein A [Sphaerochaeta sp.]
MQEEKEISSTTDGKEFHIQAFDGPLDVLLYLIQKSEVNIYDIPISQITDQYLSYLKSSTSLEIADLTQFYKMAADLLYIKSRMLLPVDLEFDEEYEDPRQELVERLLEYQKFRKYTELLATSGGSGEFFITRKQSQFMLPFGDEELFNDVTLQDLLKTFSKLMTSITPNKVFNVYESVTVNEKIALMHELFEVKEYLSIADIIIHLDDPLHIICTFMAILDACKLKMIYIEQAEPFGEILIRKRENDIDENLADLYDQEYDDVTSGYEDGEIDENSELSISNEEELEFFRKDSLQDAQSGVITADDGRVFLYDEESEAEQIPLDED